MANYCDYKVIVKGCKNACYAFFGSMSCVDGKWIVEEDGTNDAYTVRFEGNCKWSVDAYCTPWDGSFPVILPEDANEAMAVAEENYWYNTVQERSKMFEVEVWCNSADVEDYDPDKGPDEIFEHYVKGQVVFDECPDILRIKGWGDYGYDEIKPIFPMVIPIEGTGYAGRNARIEYVKVGDPLIVKADYNNPYYTPVALEVFNTKGETLGYLCEGYGTMPLEVIAQSISDVKARVASVTPLSQRSKRAKYALMDVELYTK